MFTFGVAVLRVEGESMLPTLRDGAFVVVIRPALDALLRGTSAPRSGDVVVVAVPATGERVVKRVVATGGETITIDDGVVVIDGVAVEQPANLAARAGHSHLEPTRVPANELFVLGDNRLPLASRDSRSYGTVPVRAVHGRVLLPAAGL